MPDRCPYETEFVEAVIFSYANLVHSPLVIILGAYFAFTYLAIESGTLTPTSGIQRITFIIRDTTSAKWELIVAHFINKLANRLVKYEKTLVTIGFTWLPYLTKLSRNSDWISCAHIVIAFLNRK